MSEIRIISAAEVERLFTVKMALEAVEKAYTAKEGGSGSVWPMVSTTLKPASPTWTSSLATSTAYSASSS